jgi:hypothetical protein
VLSFGLMMTGCDSGSGDTINAADYISIDVDTAGAAGPPAVAAIYKVTVKQPVPAANKAVFASVAVAAGVNPAKIKYRAASSATEAISLDADFDAKLITVLGALAAGDKFVVTDDTRTFESISFLNVAAPTVAKLQTALVTALNGAAGAKYTAAAGKTLDLSATGAAVVITSHASAGSVILLPTIATPAADGGGAAIKFTGGSTHAKSQGTANSTTIGTSAETSPTAFTFAGAAATDTTILTTSAAVIAGELQAATVVTDDAATKGTIRLNGNSSNDATISAATKFETAS